MAESAHAIAPKGHVLSEQSAPEKPSKHCHTPHGLEHNPFALHEFGQGVYSDAFVVESAMLRKAMIPRNRECIILLFGNA